MLTFPKYESYQTTNVGWLGDIPNHWGLKKSKFLLKEKKKTVGAKSNDFTLLSLTLNGLIARDIENPQGKFPAEFNTYKIVEPDDLVFCLFDVEETPRTVGHASLRGMITGAYDIFECGSVIDSKYLYYYYLSLDFDKRLQPLYSGLRKVIKLDAFLGAKSPVPPLEEQKRIVEFLDCSTAEIDRAIAQKQRLIELLQEQKAILINQAVTKGLNPNVPMRDSGVEWIDDIPKHRQLERVKNIFRLIVEPALNNYDMELLSVYSDIGVKPRRELEERGNKASTTDGYWMVRKGDLIVNKLLAWMGAIGLSNYDGVTSPAYDVLRPQVSISGEYFNYLFRMPRCTSELKKHSRGIMEMRLRL